ncbi:peptidyl-prolyl cis-trans isomerase FKBP17-1, chloroplastic isoform X2 [Mangifera indica]|uniref:peptidyl-prolyl cis-trans isomerase FKBP17-1, chloroplastic isoform X2 n=1 Tax=Mangifera indica TaxID=29780 RepID=UPI001CFBEB9B|nr:peptidyl-prolyl cis-trans isomerase FKBP17-1, chloroplastic isoform X2 [Mangifera indica]
MIQCFASLPPLHASHHHTLHFLPSRITATLPSSSSSPFLSTTTSRRAALSLSIITTTLSTLTLPFSSPISSTAADAAELSELPNSGGVKSLDLRTGSGPIPLNGDQVAIHYYGRLAAKQGWRFDSTYDHKDGSGEPVPFVFTLGSGKVIPGIEAAVRSMKFFDRQRLFTTIFNPTRLANGEGSTLGTLIFDIELVSLRH